MESPRPGSSADEVIAVVRAASGGLLFGVPLLYTMEVWWLGEHSSPVRMLSILAAVGVVLVALNSTAGFRSTKDVRVVDAVGDTIRALAIGIVATAAVLVMLREVTIESPLSSALGKIVNESVPFCLGIGVTRFLLSGNPTMAEEEDEEEEGGDAASSSRTRALNATVADVGATILGACFVGLSIAPTEEVPMLTAAMEPKWLVVVLVASFATSYAIVFVAGFVRQDERHDQEGLFQSPVVETTMTYVVSLAVAALLLWIFQRDVSPASDLLARTVVLGFPACIGGAFGRLAI